METFAPKIENSRSRKWEAKEEVSKNNKKAKHCNVYTVFDISSNNIFMNIENSAELLPVDTFIKK